MVRQTKTKPDFQNSIRLPQVLVQIGAHKRQAEDANVYSIILQRDLKFALNH